MRLIGLAVALVFGGFAEPHSAQLRPFEKVHRIGYLSPADSSHAVPASVHQSLGRHV